MHFFSPHRLPFFVSIEMQLKEVHTYYVILELGSQSILEELILAYVYSRLLAYRLAHMNIN